MNFPDRARFLAIEEDLEDFWWRIGFVLLVLCIAGDEEDILSFIYSLNSVYFNFSLILINFWMISKKEGREFGFGCQQHSISSLISGRNRLRTPVRSERFPWMICCSNSDKKRYSIFS